GRWPLRVPGRALSALAGGCVRDVVRARSIRVFVGVDRPSPCRSGPDPRASDVGRRARGSDRAARGHAIAPGAARRPGEARRALIAVWTRCVPEGSRCLGQGVRGRAGRGRPMSRSKSPATQAVRAALETDTQHGAVVPPIHLTSTYAFKSFGVKGKYDYTRSGNPTRDALADAIA